MPQLPDVFLRSIDCCTGYDESAFIEAHQQDVPVSVRLNPFKPAALPPDIKSRVPWCAQGFYLAQRPHFTHDLFFQAGCYYVQEAGSMFIEHVMKAKLDLAQPLKVLDLCASPGGKSTLAVSLLNPESLLVANDVIRPRADVLAQNLSKWGTCNVIVTNNDPKDFSEIIEEFDVIIVDAPCSGSGLFRKQEDAISEWSPENVNLCSQRQKRILADVLPSLKRGGLLIYSTCSYSKQENEDIVDWLVQDQHLHSEKIILDKSWGIVESSGSQPDTYGYRFYPDKTLSEGFFCAALTKTATETGTSYAKSKKNYLEAASKKEMAIAGSFVNVPAGTSVIRFKEDLLMMNSAVRDFVNTYQNRLYYKKVGLRLGTLIKEELIPNHELALSIYLKDDVNRLEAGTETLIRFFKKEAFTVEGGKGWMLMSYGGLGLGWIKNLGNRVNNYLPNDYKIIH